MAFYDALETNDSAVNVLGEPTLKNIASELVSHVRKSVTIDWTLRESAQAQIRILVRRIFRKYGYLPDSYKVGTPLPPQPLSQRLRQMLTRLHRRSKRLERLPPFLRRRRILLHRLSGFLRSMSVAIDLGLQGNLFQIDVTAGFLLKLVFNWLRQSNGGKRLKSLYSYASIRLPILYDEQ